MMHAHVGIAVLSRAFRSLSGEDDEKFLSFIDTSCQQDAWTLPPQPNRWLALNRTRIFPWNKAQ